MISPCLGTDRTMHNGSFRSCFRRVYYLCVDLCMYINFVPPTYSTTVFTCTYMWVLSYTTWNLCLRMYFPTKYPTNRTGLKQLRNVNSLNKQISLYTYMHVAVFIPLDQFTTCNTTAMSSLVFELWILIRTSIYVSCKEYQNNS